MSPDRFTAAARDGRTLIGQVGLAVTGFLAAVWALPYWQAVSPPVAAAIQPLMPVSYAGDPLAFLGILLLGAIFVGLDARSSALTADASTETAADTRSTDDVWEQAPVTTRSTIAPHEELEDRSLSGSISVIRGSLTADDTSADLKNTDTDTEDAQSPQKSATETEETPGKTDENEWELPAEPPGERDDSTADTSDLSEYTFDWVTETNVRMADVGGMDDVKEELHRDIVTPMKEDPEKAERYDIPLPNLLLHGPPGTGKTYLAKALATELGLPFVKLSGSDVTSKWINASSEKVGELFDEAEALAGEAGGAVIFLDELDAVLPERSGESHEENRKVVNEFLSHLQESSRNKVLFVGATNKREDLDSAATRNGRIDKEIFVGEPDEEARVKIFKAQLAGRPHDLSEDDIEELAAVTDGVVAADIEGIVNQAARNAAYGRDAPIEMEDIVRQLDQ